MDAGKEIMKQCSYIIIGSRFGLSEGMMSEIEAAIELGIVELAVTKHGLETVYGKK